MKIKPEHYAHMKAAIQAHIEAYNTRMPHPFPTQKQYEDQGLTAKRYRWDLHWAAKLGDFICKEVYPYANDDHYDTALRNIVKELGL